MKTILVPVKVELSATDNEADIRAKLDTFCLTGAGITYLDNEYKKPVSLVKSACHKFLKRVK